MLAIAGAASAETPRNTPAAVEVDRDAAPAGRVGFGFDGGEAVDTWGASIAASWIEAPIRLGAGTFGAGTPATEPVRRRETLALGGAIAIGGSIVFDAALRASHQVGDRLRAAGTPGRLARFVVHDLRLGVRVRVAGDDARAALLRGDLTLPVGDDDHFAGDARWTAAWRLIGRATLPGELVIAATAGIRLHGAEVVVGDRLIGDELFGAAGIAVPLSSLGLGRSFEQISVTGELAGALGDDVGALPAPSPLEARAGAIVRLRPELTLGAHVGAGLVDQIGAPRLRALFEVAWTPRRPAAASPDPSPPDDDDDDDDDGVRQAGATTNDHGGGTR